MSPTDGMVKIHRIMMFEKLGRVLSPQDIVHHMDRDKLNWSIDNLELTTRSDHSKEHAPAPVYVICASCGKNVKISPGRLRHRKNFCGTKCRDSYQEKTNWPSDKELRMLVWDKPVTAIAYELGVSGAAVKKRCKGRGIETPYRGYWSKTNSYKKI